MTGKLPQMIHRRTAMPRGRRTSYTRDNRGRFASSPGGGGPKRSTPATRRAATRAGNRLNRDNAGRISGIGRDGATVRGGRIRTAKGNRRATQIASMRPAGFRSGTIAKGGRGVSGPVARSLAAVRRERAGRVPAAQRPGSLTSTLRGTLRAVARADAARIRELEAITGQKIKPTAAGAKAGTEAGARVRATAKGGKVAGTLRAGLRELAQSDARTAREMAAIVRDATPKVAGAKGGKAIRGGRASLPAGKPAKKATKGPKVKLPRMATPTGVIRGSDRAKVKADARKGIGTPYSRASQRAFDRSAREAPLQRKQAIAAAKRKGRTGFGKGPQMNARSIGNRDFNWNRSGDGPATAQERLAMWRKGERRMRGFWSGGRGVAGAYAGDLRASRRAAALVDSGNRLGNLPTTRKMAEQPRQRRNDRISRNETQGRLASSEASRRLLPQIQKVRDAAQKRIAEGKKPTAAQKEKERKLVGEYNKAARKLQVAQAAKEYTSNPYGFKPQRMSGTVKAAKKPTAPKRTRASRPAGTVRKPRGMKRDPWIRKERVIGKGEVWMGRWQNPSKRTSIKVDTSASAVKARRKRALAPKNSTYLSQKMETRSAIVRSAANAIYNRQQRIARQSPTGLFVDAIRQAIAIMPPPKGLRQRLTTRAAAEANLEAARKRVASGRKGRR